MFARPFALVEDLIFFTHPREREKFAAGRKNITSPTTTQIN
jgi:hypothetical protein